MNQLRDEAFSDHLRHHLPECSVQCDTIDLGGIKVWLGPEIERNYDNLACIVWINGEVLCVEMFRTSKYTILEWEDPGLLDKLITTVKRYVADVVAYPRD